MNTQDEPLPLPDGWCAMSEAPIGWAPPIGGATMLAGALLHDDPSTCVILWGRGDRRALELEHDDPEELATVVAWVFARADGRPTQPAVCTLDDHD